MSPTPTTTTAAVDFSTFNKYALPLLGASLGLMVIAFIYMRVKECFEGETTIVSFLIYNLNPDFTILNRIEGKYNTVVNGHFPQKMYLNSHCQSIVQSLGLNESQFVLEVKA